MTPAKRIWISLLALGLVHELDALTNSESGDPLAERIRALFQVHTGVGRAAFLIVWLPFAAWPAAHLSVKKPCPFLTRQPTAYR
ncbi:hypothetical protein [Streptomyces coerulescens]|uniref:Uncharacterized protein n=1 Tax=Streptomyces coerulescens TaxID=29304 RepID=A0ABW0D1T2_STRCD